jgi:hypothetical protein
MVIADAVAVEGGPVIVRARGREAVGEVQGAPLGADQGGVDVAVAGEEVASVRIGAERQELAGASGRVGRPRVEARAATLLVGGLVIVVRDRQCFDEERFAKTRRAVTRVAQGRFVAGRRVAGRRDIVGGRRADADHDPGGARVIRGRADADLEPIKPVAGGCAVAEGGVVADGRGAAAFGNAH